MSSSPIRLARTKKRSSSGYPVYALRYGPRYRRTWAESCWIETLLCKLDSYRDLVEEKDGVRVLPTEDEYNAVQEVIRSSDANPAPIYSYEVVPATAAAPMHLVFRCLYDDTHWDIRLVDSHPLAGKFNESPRAYMEALEDPENVVFVPITYTVRSQLGALSVIDMLRSGTTQPDMSTKLLLAAVETSGLPASVLDFKVDLNDGTLRGTIYNDNGDPFKMHRPRSKAMANAMLLDSRIPFFVNSGLCAQSRTELLAKIQTSPLPDALHTLDTIVIQEDGQIRANTAKLLEWNARETARERKLN